MRNRLARFDTWALQHWVLYGILIALGVSAPVLVLSVTNRRVYDWWSGLVSLSIVLAISLPSARARSQHQRDTRAPSA